MNGSLIEAHSISRLWIKTAWNWRMCMLTCIRVHTHTTFNKILFQYDSTGPGLPRPLHTTRSCGLCYFALLSLLKNNFQEKKTCKHVDGDVIDEHFRQQQRHRFILPAASDPLHNWVRQHVLIYDRSWDLYHFIKKIAISNTTQEKGKIFERKTPTKGQMLFSKTISAEN